VSTARASLNFSTLVATGAHFEKLVLSDEPQLDVHELLRWLCTSTACCSNQTSVDDWDAAVVGRAEYPRTQPPRLDNSRVQLASEANGSSACGFSREESIVVSTCSVQQLWPEAWRLADLWRAICQYCGVQCIEGTPTNGSLHYNQDTPAVMIDTACVLSSTTVDLRGAQYAVVHFSWDPAEVRTLYHYRGSLLAHVVRSERIAGDLHRLQPGSRRRGLCVRMDQMRSIAGFRTNWRNIFVWLGLPAASIRAILQHVLRIQAQNFTSRLRTHCVQPTFA